MGFAACMYVRYAMDSTAYTMYGILLMILSFTMYSFDFGHLRKDEYSNITDKSRKTVLISVIVLVILGVASCASYFFHITPVSYDKSRVIFILRLTDIPKIIMFSIL